MKFKDTTDDLDYSGIFLRRISENGLVHFGVCQMAFGHRVRAGFVDDLAGVALDWCGGASWENVEYLYSIVQGILEKKEEDRTCFDDLPGLSRIKPFNLDKPFTEYILQKAGEFEMIELVKPRFAL